MKQSSCHLSHPACGPSLQQAQQTTTEADVRRGQRNSLKPQNAQVMESWLPAGHLWVFRLLSPGSLENLCPTSLSPVAVPVPVPLCLFFSVSLSFPLPLASSLSKSTPSTSQGSHSSSFVPGSPLENTVPFSNLQKGARVGTGCRQNDENKHYFETLTRSNKKIFVISITDRV